MQKLVLNSNAKLLSKFDAKQDREEYLFLPVSFALVTGRGFLSSEVDVEEDAFLSL